MKSISLLSGLAALALSGVATAQTAPKVRADANRDGVVSQAEFSAKLGQRFAKLDVNSDGRLTREDRQARRAANPERAERRQAKKAQRIAKFDTNKDGTLSQTERQAAKAQRQAMRAERQATRAQRLAARGGVRADANGDKAISLAEFQARGLQRFARLDTNRDGGLSKAERQAGKAQRQARRAQRRG